jgi:hypothetical protein
MFMKGLILSALGGLMLASIGSGYADVIRFTVINESSSAANLIIKSGQNRTIPVGIGAAKMLTANYTYPDQVLVQSRGAYPKPCNWSMPRVGKQIIKMITINISTDKSTNTQNCLLTGNVEG